MRLSDQSTVWQHRQRAPSSSAVLPTGGGVVFAGDIDRYFRAFDDQTGKVLWQIRTNNTVNSFPITFTANGKQYVAVATGNGSGFLRSMSQLAPSTGRRFRLETLLWFIPDWVSESWL